jgi:hypothetical protein
MSQTLSKCLRLYRSPFANGLLLAACLSDGAASEVVGRGGQFGICSGQASGISSSNSSWMWRYDTSSRDSTMMFTH